MLKNYTLKSKKPSMVWVNTELVTDRIDAKYFDYIFLENEERIKNDKVKKLNKLCKIFRGSTPKQSDYKNSTNNFVIKGDNLTSLGLKYESIPTVSDEYFQKNKSNRLKFGSVLISSIGTGSTGKADILSKEGNYLTVAENTICEKNTLEIDMFYLVSYLRTKYGKLQLLRNEKGSSGQTHLYPTDLGHIEIPIVEDNIQKYIGDKVRKAEELREEAKRLKKEAEHILYRELNLIKLEESLESSINSKHNWITSMNIIDRIDSYYYKKRYILVNQHLNNYECIKIRDIASVDYGYMPTEDYNDENNGVPLIRVTNMIGNLLLDLSDLKYISKSINIPNDKYLDDGDILVVQCGNTTGKIALITKEVENYLYPSFCLRIKLKNKSINNRYLALLMEMSIIQEQIWQSASYSSVRPNTTKPAIENIKIPLIEKQKQEGVGTLVEKYIDNIHQSKQLIQEAKQDVEDLIEGNFDTSKVKVKN